MEPGKIKKGYLSWAFKSAVVIGFATFMAPFLPSAQAQNTVVKQDTAVTTKVENEPWQTDKYFKEMNLAQKAYEAKVEAINQKAKTDKTKVKTERFVRKSGNTVIVDPIRAVIGGPKTKAAVKQIEANAAAQLFSLEQSFNYQVKYIKEKYKQDYEREQAQILRTKKATAKNTPEEEKLMLKKKDVDLAKRQLALEKEELELEKQKQALEKQKQEFAKQKANQTPKP